MRVLLDTNVLVRATSRANGPARELFLQLLDPPHVIIASNFLLDELRRVMNYSRVQRVHGLTPQEVDEFVRDFEALAQVIDVPIQLPFQVRHDPDDDPIVSAAVYGRVDVLCTLDRHLRRPDVITYCAPFNVRILTDVELLAELRAGNSTSSA
jgi:putative PIN family toxin of toxin-antitoxin system